MAETHVVANKVTIIKNNNQYHLVVFLVTPCIIKYDYDQYNQHNSENV
ncbi:putative ATPase [Chitinophagaceae bacterium OAS944]|nr:putative ATPase [Chitinophagaceae bacterium OAS944]